jgi:multisubunit Na+/H+ antiporter MnhC subunit
MGGWLPQVLIVAVMLVGLYAALSRRSPVRTVLGLAVAACAVNLLLVALGYCRPEAGAGPGAGLAPVESAGAAPQQALAMVDPLPQALALGAGLAGLGVLLLGAAICLRLGERAGTGDAGGIKRLRG